MKEFVANSIAWEHTEGEKPLMVHYHFYQGPEIPMGQNPSGGFMYRDMSQLVVTDVQLNGESVLLNLKDHVPSFREFDRFIDELEYTLSGECE